MDGEVLFPGLIEIKGPTTLFQALSLARGMRESARLSNIIVIRKDSEGKAMSTNIDYRKIIDGQTRARIYYSCPMTLSMFQSPILLILTNL